MVLPAFVENGNLPPGVYRVSLAQAIERFGEGSIQRRIVADRLNRIHALVKSTGKLARFVVFGSFVTSKDEPNDLDVVLLMDDDFELDAVTGEAALAFHHLEAQSLFGASIFWTRRSAAIGGEQAMIEYWQACREGGQRGIIEISSENP